jgi:hypothetical protein
MRDFKRVNRNINKERQQFIPVFRSIRIKRELEYTLILEHLVYNYRKGDGLEMKAIIIDHYGSKEELKERQMPKPVPKEGEVLIEMHATSINPIDWKLREGHLQEMMPFNFPIILGWDAAGIVSEIGPNVSTACVGDRVLVRPKLLQREPMQNI